MPTTVNKLLGTLKLGDTATGMAMEAQVAQVGTPQTVTRDSPVTVLTGDVVQASATYSWALTGQALLDLSDPDGVFYFVNENQGQQMPFTFLPIGAAGPTDRGHGHRRRLGHRGAGGRVDRAIEVHVADAGRPHGHPADSPQRRRRRGGYRGAPLCPRTGCGSR